MSKLIATLATGVALSGSADAKAVEQVTANTNDALMEVTAQVNKENESTTYDATADFMGNEIVGNKTNESTEALDSPITSRGNFLAKDLGIKMDKNTEETIQNYFGTLPTALQDETKNFLLKYPSLFNNIENTILALEEFIIYFSNQKLIDKNWTRITEKLSATHEYSDEELDIILDEVAQRREKTKANTDLWRIILQNRYDKCSDPVKKAELGKEITRIEQMKKENDENSKRLAEQKIQNDESENARKESENARKETERINLENISKTYMAYKDNPTENVRAFLIKSADYLDTKNKEDLSPELQELIENIDQIKGAKN